MTNLIVNDIAKVVKDFFLLLKLTCIVLVVVGEERGVGQWTYIAIESFHFTLVTGR